MSFRPWSKSQIINTIYAPLLGRTSTATIALQCHLWMRIPSSVPPILAHNCAHGFGIGKTYDSQPHHAPWVALFVVRSTSSDVARSRIEPCDKSPSRDRLPHSLGNHLALGPVPVLLTMLKLRSGLSGIHAKIIFTLLGGGTNFLIHTSSGARRQHVLRVCLRVRLFPVELIIHPGGVRRLHRFRGRFTVSSPSLATLRA